MDEDINNMLTNFIGQTYGEILKLDKNIVGQSQHLRPKSNEFKTLATNILSNKIQPTDNNYHQTRIPAQQPTIVQVQPTQPTNTDQLEFNFNKSVDIEKIYNVLCNIENKLNDIDSRLQKLEQI